MRTTLMIFIFCVFTVTSFAGDESQYKGQQKRDIKALSQENIDAYLSGKGMGLAKAAELNHYPGPLHVLEIRNELELTDLQTKKTQDLFNRMQISAIELGKQLVAKEQELDTSFAEGSINTNTLDKILSDIGALQAKLRFVHLSAHLEQKQILSKHQVMLYDRLRGYRSNSHGDHNHSH